MIATFFSAHLVNSAGLEKKGHPEVALKDCEGRNQKTLVVTFEQVAVPVSHTWWV